MAHAESHSLKLAEFRNEPYTDFTQPSNRRRMEEALARVRGQLGREYDILIAGERIRAEEKLRSVNPARPDEIVGIHQKATSDLANRAVETAYRNFTHWSRTPAEDRIGMLVRTAALMRERKYEFDAWLVYEAGKTWPEAEAEVAEAIDFCEYYAREMERLAGPQTVVQLPGERDEMRYLPLGAGVVIPPWNFPLAILCGMTCAALVAGNTVVIKPSSETPTIAAVFAATLLEAGFPPESFCFLTGSGGAIGDILVSHPKTRFVSFTGSRDVGLHINELAARPQKGQIWIKRVVAEMGGKDAIIVDRDCDLDAAVEGVAASAFGFQGQKCSACSRAIVDEAVYDSFLDKLAARTKKIVMGPPEDPATALGPVISAGAKKTIRQYVDIGKQEGRLIGGNDPAPEPGHFVPPTIIADVPSNARVFQEEIFGPVLAVTKARDFDHALSMANDSQYGLTGAIYSNDKSHVARARDEFFVGNMYVNRKCTGAMVGAHPFGGFNMSGTDSKAGGPDYLLLFLQAKSIAEKL
ncbi:MAG TPA: L-glutamate gamma-semialdehyde dehydrogenase [Bryobacteraceae bacterium]|nr:L-glutamate gamma-semialdehyde dehydrogenase [Bryobacteraceae bacterium]